MEIKRIGIGQLVKERNGENVGKIVAHTAETISIELAGSNEVIEAVRANCIKATAEEYTSAAELAFEAEIEATDIDEEEKQDSFCRLSNKRYEPFITCNDSLSYDNGDEVAIALRALTLADTYAACANVIGTAKGELIARYSHLNNGQQRMNLGNRIRAAFRKADEAQRRQILAICSKENYL